MALMYFGTRGYETWVKAPLAGGDHSRVGYAATLDYLNGGAGAVFSQSAHREYSWSWGNGTTRDDLRAIVDFAEGIYDSQDGTNLIYFIDPMTADKNVLPQNWATPSLGAADGVSLFNDQEPIAVQTPANTFRYPARGASYTNSAQPNNIYIPVPPGYSLWLGVHGEQTGGASVHATCYDGYTQGADYQPDLLGVTTSTLCNFNIDRSAPVVDPTEGFGLNAFGDGMFGGTSAPVADFTGVELWLDVPAAATLTLYGLVAQVLKIGQTPGLGSFVSGQGHSGCVFSAHPTESPYSSLGAGAVGATAKLIEIGSWS